MPTVGQEPDGTVTPRRGERSLDVDQLRGRARPWPARRRRARRAAPTGRAPRRRSWSSSRRSCGRPSAPRAARRSGSAQRTAAATSRRVAHVHDRVRAAAVEARVVDERRAAAAARRLVRAPPRAARAARAATGPRTPPAEPEPQPGHAAGRAEQELTAVERGHVVIPADPSASPRPRPPRARTRRASRRCAGGGS